MNTTNPNIIIRNVSDFTGEEICSSTDKLTKIQLVEDAINPTKYNVLGFVDRTNSVVLQTRYYNVRDSRGRFARVVGNRRSR